MRFGAASRRGVGGVVVVSRRAGKGREGKEKSGGEGIGEAEPGAGSFL